VNRRLLQDLGVGLVGAVAITALLLLAAAQLVSERPQEQDITEPVPVALVAMPEEEEAERPEEVREPEPPEEPPQMDFMPELPLPSLTAPALAGPSVELDPRLFGGAPRSGPMIFNATELDRPPRAVVRTPPVYPFKARQRRIEGTVQVRFLVRVDGTVDQIRIESADPPGVFEDAAREAIARWRFEPGQLAGETVASWVVMPIRFDLDGGR
jgi:protein TonB